MSEFCDKCELQASRVHRLPKDPERAREWVKCLKWEEKAEELMKVKNLSSFFICSGHFTKESYRNGKYDQPLLRGAVPTIVSPLVPTLTYSDHNYLEERHPTISGSSDNEMEVDCEPMQAPLPNRNYSKQSHQTDCTWNSLGTDSTRRHGEVFTDVETVMEKKRRRRDEFASMRETALEYSLLAHSSLLELLDFTPGCIKCRNIAAKRTFKTIGTAIEMTTQCATCKKWTWCSSSKVHDDRLGGILESNMNLSVATFACGIPYERLDDLCTTMKMGIPRKKTYYDILRENVKPVVDEMYEEDMQDTRSIIYNSNKPTAANSKEKVPLSIIGDAQFDSRGFSASACRYITMDYTTRLILDFEVQIRKENQGNSPIMESRAFARIMERLSIDERFDIGRVTTDKNASVIAHLHKNYPQIQHRLDKWHVLKLLKKHYLAVVERVKNSNLRVHWEHLLVHIWISIEAADGNAALAVELIRSAEYHLQGIHDLPQDQFKLLKHCMHGPLIDDPNRPRAYLDPTKHKTQIGVLHEMLNNDSFLDNVRRCAARETTSPCESFHSLAALIYLKKNVYYDKQTTTTLTKLCCLHHNSHRKEILDRASRGIIPPTRKKYSRTQKRIREVINQPKPSLLWKRQLLQRVRSDYCEKKEHQIAHRSVGRPKAAILPPPTDDGDSSDDEVLDVDENPLDRSETEDIIEDSFDDNEELAEDTLPQPNSSSSISYPPATPKVIIKVSPRQFQAVYNSMGADADNYIYVHNRSGERMIFPD